jgi:hypothetical protein
LQNHVLQWAQKVFAEASDRSFLTEPLRKSAVLVDSIKDLDTPVASGVAMTQTQSIDPSPEELAQRQVVAERVARDVAQIATLPELTIEIIEVAEDPNATATDLEHIISHDPALCTRVLKVINSSFYSLPT